MTLEMRKTLLVIGGFCIFLVLLEECINSGHSKRHASRDGLATDELVEGMSQSRDGRIKILKEEDKVNAYKKTDVESRKIDKQREKEMADRIENRRRKEKQMAEQKKNEMRKEERELEIQKNRERKAKEEEIQRQRVLRIKQEQMRVKQLQARQENRGGSDLRVEKKKDEAEKVLEDDDEDEDVDTDVEEEKPNDSNNNDTQEDEEEYLNNVPDEEEEIENERLEKSPYILSPEQDKQL
ncbi:hypothetical protein ElyMa_002303400 [Elysia marginata]|uniref:Uncharacterized protein n=1 Tax=Elysia marginata TaxID=1093978 RepID=A0AAV4G3D6_9GAST|nr:hypothetical protein ElyMa_002303400 [Elysia marginata]